MNGLRNFGILAATLISLATISCGQPGAVNNSYPALANSNAKAGFDFATSRSVVVKMSAAKKGAISISTAEGKLIFSGTLDPATPLRLKLPVATRDSKLVAEQDVGGVATRVDLPIVSGAASYAFN